MKINKILFVHQNFPGQYKYLAPMMAKLKDFEVSSLSMTPYTPLAGINQNIYNLKVGTSLNIHKYATEFETKLLRAEASADKAYELKNLGYYPDIIVGHTGWGELLFLKEVWPETKYLSYVEFFYNLENSDIDFDDTVFMDKSPYIRRKLIARNSAFLSQYLISDRMITPTNFQKNTFPDILKKNIKVIHEGIDTEKLKPSLNSYITIDKKKFTKKDKIVLFISRCLEPYRGYHSFIRSIPGILKEHPDAKIFIIGGDQKGYGAEPEEGTTHRENFFNEIKDKVDISNIYFLGLIDYEAIRACYQIATLHVYLTYPFVLSWSMLESMSCEGLIVGSDTGPVSEIITHKKNGLLVDFFNYEEISSRINSILDDPQKYLSIRKNARKTILKNYDLWTKCLPRQEALIREVLESD